MSSPTSEALNAVISRATASDATDIPSPAGGVAPFSMVLSSGRRGSTGLVQTHGENRYHSSPGGGGSAGGSPSMSTHRLGSYGGGSGLLLPHHASRLAPTLNSCRCLNITYTVGGDPSLSAGEARVVESLFGSAEGSMKEAGNMAAQAAQMAWVQHQQQPQSALSMISQPQQQPPPSSSSQVGTPVHSHTPTSSISSSNINASLNLFPDGYFVGRPLHRSYEQESLVARRPHPWNGDWIVERCLNCHLDVFATNSGRGSGMRLMVASLRGMVGEEIRRARDGDNYSKFFRVLLRNNAGSGGNTANNAATAALAAIAESNPAAAAITELVHTGIPISSNHLLTAALSASQAPPSGSTTQPSSLAHSLPPLKAALDQSVEAERIAMEARLSQIRAVEEGKLKVIEERIRRDCASLVAALERESENGPLALPPGAAAAVVSAAAAAAAAAGTGGNSPRLGAPRAFRKKSPIFPGQDEEDSAAEGTGNEDIEGHTSPTRAIDLAAAAVSRGTSRGVSPSHATSQGGGFLALSRTNSRGSGGSGRQSRGSRDSSMSTLTPPPLGTSSDERAASAANAAAHRLATSVIAVPLDLDGDSPAQLSRTPIKRQTMSTSTGSNSGGSGLGVGAATAGSSAPKNRDQLPAPPRLPQPADDSPVLAGQQGPERNTQPDAESDTSPTAINEGGQRHRNNSGGVHLIPFEDQQQQQQQEASSATSPLIGADGTPLTADDGFILPTGRTARDGDEEDDEDASDKEEGIFELDEEIEDREEAEAEAQAAEAESPRVRDEDESGPEHDDEEEEEEEEEELSDEEMQQPISGKAAKLLGMGNQANNGPAGAPTSVATAIIRPRTMSGSVAPGPVTMVPMSLPIAIPKQLAGQESTTGGTGSKNSVKKSHHGRTHDGSENIGKPEPAGAESGLSRSLKAQERASKTAGFAAPSLQRSLSSDESESDSESANALLRHVVRPSGSVDDDDDAEPFIPPHTLVMIADLKHDQTHLDQRHLTSVRNSASMSMSNRSVKTTMKVQHFDTETGKPIESVDGSIGSLPPSWKEPSASALSSSLPRVAGSLGAPLRHIRPMALGGTAASTGSASSIGSGSGSTGPAASGGTGSSRLGFQATNSPPPKSSHSASRGQMPSSRNPAVMQQHH